MRRTEKNERIGTLQLIAGAPNYSCGKPIQPGQDAMSQFDTQATTEHDERADENDLFKRFGKCTNTTQDPALMMNCYN